MRPEERDDSPINADSVNRGKPRQQDGRLTKRDASDLFLGGVIVSN